MNHDEIHINSINELLKHLNLVENQKHEHFHIISFSDRNLKIPKRLNIKSENYFEITFSRKGNTEVLIDGELFHSRKNQIGFLSPKQSIRIDNSKGLGDKEGYILFFTVDFLRNFRTVFNLIQHFPFFNIHFSPIYFIENEKSELFLELMKKMYDKFNHSSENNFEIIKSYLNILLLEAKDLIKKNGNTQLSRAEEITFQFENLLKEKDKRRLVRDYADTLNISSIYLSECVKSTTGKSAKQVITEYKIWEAKSLLTFSEKTVDEIALITGFDDRSNFINFFKKNTNFSPTKYRKNTNLPT
ncbi:helix-turn-helix domain-containing protein [uncultured Tenacibaculum sp.]|uniref:helix-turn-helix domain-containing protein n=1 Tax=uncultured Tenacibaculum sp. TaxID=174713 RepID=UPI00263069F8|nr:helix-turn-helix domain-containing protein [uncultured Tenacibaculum sp.]